jgi:glyceraldehyde 3-phosphate dehydrogenase
MGVNDGVYDKARHHVISNASCTTNCVAPMAKVLNDTFGIVKGLMTTIHSYTQDQKLQDGPHKDHRRARAAALSMIPTSTGAAKAVGLVLPELKGKLDGFAMRVPTPNVSVTDLTCELKKPATVDSIRKAFKDAAQKNPYLKVVEQALVSVDFNGNNASCSFDSGVVYVVGENLVKILGWYDNEMGYSTRVADLAEFIAAKGL